MLHPGGALVCFIAYPSGREPDTGADLSRRVPCADVALAPPIETCLVLEAGNAPTSRLTRQ